MGDCTNEKAGLQPGSFDTTNTRNSIGKSTATEAQERRMLNALLKRSSVTTDGFRALGIYQVSARIFGLRAKGYNIVTELFDGFAADGFSHKRMARYRLVGTP